MNVKDIHIGNWLRLRYYRGEKEIVVDFKVTEIVLFAKRVYHIYGEKADGTQSNMGDVNDIEPIPLTPEILEKNGFDFLRNDNKDSVWNGWWIYEGLELATACLNKKGNWPCFINIYDSNITCEYVHQLQNALNICKIDKEIEL